jgi:hypothetical protein
MEGSGSGETEKNREVSLGFFQFDSFLNSKCLDIIV